MYSLFFNKTMRSDLSKNKLIVSLLGVSFWLTQPNEVAGSDGIHLNNTAFNIACGVILASMGVYVLYHGSKYYKYSNLNPDEMLGYAVLTKDIWGIKYSINLGADVNSKMDDFGASLLHYAAIRGDTKLAKSLLDNGALVDATDTNYPSTSKGLNGAHRGGFSPLHYACIGGHTGVVKLLLEHGANPNKVDERGHTPLHYAVTLGKNSQCINCVPDFNGYSNYEFAQKSYVTHYACDFKTENIEHYIKVVKSLIEYKADPYKKRVLPEQGEDSGNDYSPIRSWLKRDYNSLDVLREHTHHEDELIVELEEVYHAIEDILGTAQIERESNLILCNTV